jgi:hypothetical protein
VGWVEEGRLINQFVVVWQEHGPASLAHGGGRLQVGAHQQQQVILTNLPPPSSRSQSCNLFGTADEFYYFSLFLRFLGYFKQVLNWSGNTYHYFFLKVAGVLKLRLSSFWFKGSKKPLVSISECPKSRWIWQFFVDFFFFNSSSFREPVNMGTSGFWKQRFSVTELAAFRILTEISN